MESLGIVEVVSLIASLASLILAMVTIHAARSSEKEVRDNFEKTQKMMVDYESRIKDVLSEIDKKSAIIEKTVSESQKDLMATMTNIINETVIPKKEDMGEQFAMMFVQQLLTNPEQASGMMEALQSFIDMAQKEGK